jgi:hypothetical protein
MTILISIASIAVVTCYSERRRKQLSNRNRPRVGEFGACVGKTDIRLIWDRRDRPEFFDWSLSSQ